jgi:hypothetical protein
VGEGTKQPEDDILCAQASGFLFIKVLFCMCDNIVSINSINIYQQKDKLCQVNYKSPCPAILVDGVSSLTTIADMIQRIQKLVFYKSQNIYTSSDK